MNRSIVFKTALVTTSLALFTGFGLEYRRLRNQPVLNFQPNQGATTTAHTDSMVELVAHEFGFHKNTDPVVAPNQNAAPAAKQTPYKPVFWPLVAAYDFIRQIMADLKMFDAIRPQNTVQEVRAPEENTGGPQYSGRQPYRTDTTPAGETNWGRSAPGNTTAVAPYRSGTDN